MTPEDLDSLRVLAVMATPGPWWVHTRLGAVMAIAATPVPVLDDNGAHCPLDISRGDAEFIAAAREAVPALLDEVDDLRYDLQEAKARVRELEEQLAAAKRAEAGGEDLKRRIEELLRPAVAGIRPTTSPTWLPED